MTRLEVPRLEIPPVPRYYPVYLDLRDRLCVVVGGDRAALDKVEGLLASGARVRLVAAEPVSELAELAAHHPAVEHRARGYRSGDLDGAFLALSTLRDTEVALPFWDEAEALGIPANVMDDAPRCSFIAPSIVRRGDLAVAISTAGRAPALAVRLRERLERELGDHHARFLEIAGALRAPMAERHPPFESRRALWYRLVDSDVLDLLARGDEEAALDRVEEVTGICLTRGANDLGGESERGGRGRPSLPARGERERGSVGRSVEAVP